MIDISWCVSLECIGGRFSVPDGTPADEITAMVDANIQRSLLSSWSPFVSKPKDEN